MSISRTASDKTSDKLMNTIHEKSNSPLAANEAHGFIRTEAIVCPLNLL